MNENIIAYSRSYDGASRNERISDKGHFDGLFSADDPVPIFIFLFLIVRILYILPTLFAFVY